MNNADLFSHSTRFRREKRSLRPPALGKGSERLGLGRTHSLEHALVELGRVWEASLATSQVHLRGREGPH